MERKIGQFENIRFNDNKIYNFPDLRKSTSRLALGSPGLHHKNTITDGGSDIGVHRNGIVWRQIW